MKSRKVIDGMKGRLGAGICAELREVLQVMIVRGVRRTGDMDRIEEILGENPEEYPLVKRFMERGRREGRSEGRAEGRAEGLCLALGDRIRRRFGDLPPWVEARLREVTTIEAASPIFDRLTTARTLEELFP